MERRRGEGGEVKWPLRAMRSIWVSLLPLAPLHHNTELLLSHHSRNTAMLDGSLVHTHTHTHTLTYRHIHPTRNTTDKPA